MGTVADRVVLPDGARISIRAVRPDDKQALRAGFERLGPQSRYRRFFTLMNQLSVRDLAYLTEVDHHSHEALAAFDADGEGIGVARFIRSSDDPTSAEVSVAVVDDWQHRGVGTALLAKLVDRARAEGLSRFSALVLADNAPVINLVREFGKPTIRHGYQGTVEVTLELPDSGVGDALPQLLRAAASGHVTVRPGLGSSGELESEDAG
jgi:GNAT superfamily N-acetyltransferase